VFKNTIFAGRARQKFAQATKVFIVCSTDESLKNTAFQHTHFAEREELLPFAELALYFSSTSVFNPCFIRGLNPSFPRPSPLFVSPFGFGFATR
jgi:hypothetical protein